jgi:hypothetical protein
LALVTFGSANVNAAAISQSLISPSLESNGNVIRVQRRGRGAGVRGGAIRRGPAMRGRAPVVRRGVVRRGPGVVRRGAVSRRTVVRRWGPRGRRYRRGSRWYVWAPWVGGYLYFGNYNACYNSCRARGYSAPYCSDLCAW